jgi:hypothetical protein
MNLIMEDIVLYPSAMAPEPDTQTGQEAVAMPTGTAEGEMDPMTVPMKEIVSINPHIDSNASEGDNMALLPRNTVSSTLNLGIFKCFRAPI